MSLPYLAAAVLVLYLATAGLVLMASRRPAAQVGRIAVTFAAVIGVFAAMLIIAYLGVIMAAWVGQF